MRDTSLPETSAAAWPAHPSLYEINTWVWLTGLRKRYGRALTLLDVPAEEWDAIAARGFDGVWLMGVWRRSPGGAAIANRNAGLRAEFERVLPNFCAEDNVGSAYCIREYVVDPHLGGAAGLAAARGELAARGMRLLLDFVPNHVAVDHAWVQKHPEYFVLGSREDWERDPESYFEAGGRFYARGRDPYFPAWPDVLQLDAFSPWLREAATETLMDIAAQCDGVRCDMAMLLLNGIFARTWQRGEQPATEYWTDVVAAIRAQHPSFLFMAEAYWNTEWQLRGLGFDYCYDKILYDRLRGDDAEAIRLHLSADADWQRALVRFIENHDEPRAAEAFAPGKLEAAAVVAATLPGMRLFHQGQAEGQRVKLPAFLGRAPEEAADAGLEMFYQRLLDAIDAPALKNGAWQMCGASGWDDNASFERLLTWCWRLGEALYLIVVNWSAWPAQGRVLAPWPEGAESFLLEDAMAGRSYTRDAEELRAAGLYVELGAWGFHFFACRSMDAE
jgi:hypothetical protein